MAAFHQVQDELLLSSAARLLANEYEEGRRVGSLVDSTEAMYTLDNMLWTYKKGSFIPHATESDPEALNQPIYITTSLPFKNAPDVAALINLEPPVSLSQEYMLVIFTEKCPHLESIRHLYKSLKDSGCQINFIKGG